MHRFYIFHGCQGLLSPLYFAHKIENLFQMWIQLPSVIILGFRELAKMQQFSRPLAPAVSVFRQNRIFPKDQNMKTRAHSRWGAFANPHAKVFDP